MDPSNLLLMWNYAYIKIIDVRHIQLNAGERLSSFHLLHGVRYGGPVLARAAAAKNNFSHAGEKNSLIKAEAGMRLRY
ncbi:hypothetical protein [Paenibacillus sp. GXUN7292]|uniref:hypothetical protein n=1 Tax=Paenibacillus sp. GXUN7292 TaxID=3422499 RepID=UPI003D7C5735